mmetsp:Transcript_22161/g.46089  ORF Transcript_22161/g.46089 Transcript_22161/m.46089 type:complete len:83 (-) Transcript_22161:43-291(-)
MPSSTSQDEALNAASSELNECLFRQIAFCVAGAGVGFIQGYRTKSLAPLAIGGGVGTLMDTAYGWNIGCAVEVAKVDALKKS